MQRKVDTDQLPPEASSSTFGTAGPLELRATTGTGADREGSKSTCCLQMPQNASLLLPSPSGFPHNLAGRRAGQRVFCVPSWR